MSAKTYAMTMRFVAVAIAALIAVSIVRELPIFVPLAVVMLALVLSFVLRRTVKEIMTDERSRRIQERATDLAYRVYTVLGAAFALVTMMLRSQLPDWASIAGQTVAYSVCGLMLLHLAFTRYFTGRL